MFILDHFCIADHIKNETSYFENLETLGSNAIHDKREPEPEIGSAFLKMAVFTKELSALLKNVVCLLILYYKETVLMEIFIYFFFNFDLNLTQTQILSLKLTPRLSSYPNLNLNP